MDLKIEKLKFSDFRNYGTFSLDDLANLTIFIGPNGVGKTNILEGIGLLTSCESFKHAQIAQLVREGKDISRLSMVASDGNRVIETSLVLEPGKKKYQVNGKTRSITDMKGMLPAVTFTPDDLELAKRSSSVKRNALDMLGMQLSRSYHVVFRDFEKSIRYKNRLLKDEAAQALIDSINDTLVVCASQLFCYRVSLFKRMIPLVEEFYREISQSNEQFSALYLPSWNEETLSDGELNRDEVRMLLSGALERMAGEERARHRSLVGPHADKILFMLANRDASQFASQGQQRSIVLAWKLAEVEVVKRSLGAPPVLLLDDVMSELDESRRDKLVNFVTDDIQTFITATDLSSFNSGLLKKSQVVSL